MTVPRSSVAKCPDIGATSRTLGCGWGVSLAKCSSVANGLIQVFSSRTATARFPTCHAVDAEFRPVMLKPARGEELASGGDAALKLVLRKPRPAAPDDVAEGGRHTLEGRDGVGVALVELV